MADEYISKEAFTKWIDETFCKKCEAEKRDYHHCRCGSCEYDYMRCDIESFPAADVVPVRHGRWEKNDDGIMVWWECSECHRNAWHDGDNLFDYCPDCSATMMDGGET